MNTVSFKRAQDLLKRAHETETNVGGGSKRFKKVRRHHGEGGGEMNGSVIYLALTIPPYVAAVAGGSMGD
jgi:hypothetical protein